MNARDDDWEILGLEPGAGIGQIKKAYRERRALYEPAALATYSLLDDTERSDMVARIDAAYERLLDEPSSVGAGAGGAASFRSQETPPAGPPPDAADRPGAHLRYQRQKSGLSLDEIAAETKIGASLLEQIEGEAFGSLPAAVFVRGHVQQFARLVGVTDPDEFAQLYVDKMTGDDEGDD